MALILVTRPQPAADALVARLSRMGLSALAAPLQNYTDIDFDAPDLSRYQALVFTSAQAIQAFAGGDEACALPVFCVGESTAAAAKRAGYAQVYDAQDRRADVFGLVRDNKAALGLTRVLHVCGVDTAQDIALARKAAQVDVERLPVYKASLCARFAPDAERALKNGQVTCVLFFSARAATHFEALLKKDNMQRLLRHMQAVCISARVASALDAGKWASVRTARQPDPEDMLDIAATPPGTQESSAQDVALDANVVVAAFGGIRPLARHLGITASTVQGWKQRGLVPVSRIDDILDAAAACGIDGAALIERAYAPMTDDADKTSPENTQAAFPAQADSKDRRAGADRRRQRTVPDDKGYIHAEGYTGPDRRAGLDRRAYHDRQKQRIRAEKISFLNRSTVSLAFVMTALVAGAYFMLAPEIAEMEANARRVQEMESRIETLNRQIAEMNAARSLAGTAAKSPPVGAALNRTIGDVQRRVENAQAAARNLRTGDIDGIVDSLQNTRLPLERAGPAPVASVLNMLARMQDMSRTPEGRAAVEAAMARLKNALKLAGPDAQSVDVAVNLAQKQDPVLAGMFAQVDRHHMGAVALLLTMNGLRVRMGRHQPFAQDLDILLHLAGENRELKEALLRLAPFAQNGVLSTARLQKDFEGMAGDIVMARLEGEELSFKDAAMQRLSRYVSFRKMDETEGNGVDAVVARAQVQLDNGDVRGAIDTLSVLEGAPAQAAAPWIEQASGSVAAEDTGQMLSRTIFQTLEQVSQVAPVSTGSGGGFSLQQLMNVLQDNLAIPDIILRPATPDGNSHFLAPP